jgi:dTDP-4-dehydrorhamnose reductase
MNILIIGYEGQVGHELLRSLAVIGSVTGLGRGDLDLAEPGQLRPVLEAHEFDVLVNAAAYTAVDRAESEAELAFRINAEAVRVMAEVAAAKDAWLLHYSTDYVFDGLLERPYAETDEPSPQGVYARSKRAGELALAESGCRHVCLRTSWVYARRGSNFIRTMLRLAAARPELRVVADQWGAPTSAELLADVTAHVIRNLYLRGSQGAALSGLYHVTASGETSWHEYACHIVQTALDLGAELKVLPEAIVPIAASEYAAPAPRPANSRLDTQHLRATFGLELPHWRTGVSRCVAEILEPRP